ncbi:MAG: TonB-dependent receptor [Sphingomonas sp.]|nr:TonB-dependent receptor [Sphingomonas sp.]
MRNQLFFGAAIAALVMPAAASAQETTSSISGSVTSNGAPVVGAEVTITNVSSGSRSNTTTDDRGSFSASGLRIGGPYTVEISSGQGSTTVTDIYTVIGQAYTLPIELADAGGDIVVTAAKVVGAGSGGNGPQTVLDVVDISKVASVNRDIRDLARRDPFATLDLSNSRAVSFAGVNPRFNRFSVDGVLVNDNFGLNPDASPTGRGPIPLDAIGQFSVSVAPFDIRQGNFQGGAIDSVLRSGTNDYFLTGFYSQSTNGLQGSVNGTSRIVLPSYVSETYGATIAGPIIKDKLFIMVSGERNTDPRPLTPNSLSEIQNAAGAQVLSAAQLANIQSIAQNVYNYNTGGIIAISPNKDEKIVGKIDWNVTDGQRLSVSYINAFDAFTFNQNSTSGPANNPTLGLASNGYQLTELLRTGIVQLNSDWTDSFSTEVRGLYKSYSRGQDPLLGRGFAQFSVCLDPTAATTAAGGTNTSNLTTCTPSTPRVFFGPDISRQSNTFSTDTYGGSVLLRLKAGDHDFKALVEYNRVQINNLFLQNSAGSYYFDNLVDFQNRNANTIVYQDAVSLNTADAAARFGYEQFTFGLQDEWKPFSNLTLNYGARLDLYASASDVPTNPNFVNRFGFSNDQTYKGLTAFQPRASFNWKPIPRVTVRGGLGIFAGGTPDVYLSNSYSNTGITTNQISINRNGVAGAGGVFAPNGTFSGGATPAIGTASLNGVTGTSFSPTTQQFLSTNTASLPLAPTNALDPDYNLPSVFKATLTGEWQPTFLGGGWTFGADFYYSKTREAPTFTDIRSVQVGVLPDGRPRYAGLNGDNSGNFDILVRNTQLGQSFIGVVRFQKEFNWGLSFGGSYTRQAVTDASPSTSSTATSNYSNGAFADPNIAAFGTSNDETKWQFKYNIGFDHAFYKDYRTVVQLFGETRAGRPFSYTFQDFAQTNAIRGPVVGTLRTPNNRYLLYVPTGTSDPLVSYDSTATRDALNALIENSTLRNRRGQIAARNSERSRAFTRIDLHLEQEIPTFVGKSRISIFADIENLPNLLNSNWGGLRQVGFPYVVSAVQATCLQTPVADGVTPTAAQTSSSAATPCSQYRYSTFTNNSINPAPSISNSLYLIRVGARFTF